MQPLELIGQLLDGRYRVIDRIGKGGMGSVYRAEHHKLGRIVAIKVMNEQVPGELSSRKRFEREATAMAKLEHPHCASILDVGMHEGQPFVVMDFISGRGLDSLIDEGPVPVARAVEITRQILFGLAHAHELGIIHRDIKPANVVLSQKAGMGDHVKVLDFGLAKMGQETSNLTAGMVLGTPSYMAPEQIRGQLLDPRVDLYATGVVLFELLTAKKPFRTATADPLAMCMMHLNVAPPRLADVLPGAWGALEDIVARALAKEREDRFPSATAMAEALAPFGARAKTPPAGVPAASAEVMTAVLPSSGSPSGSPASTSSAAPAAPAWSTSPAAPAASGSPLAAAASASPPGAPASPASASPASPAPPAASASPAPPSSRSTSAAAFEPTSASTPIAAPPPAAPPHVSVPPAPAPSAAAATAPARAPATAAGRSRKVVIGAGAAVLIVVVIAIVASRGGSTPVRAAVSDAAIAIVAPPADDPITVDDPVESLLAEAATQSHAAAIKLLTAARKLHPTDARIPYRIGLLHMDKLYWGDGLKHLRAAIVLDTSLRSDPELIKAALRGFNTTARYDYALASFLHDDVGAAAKPFLEATAKDHANPIVRQRAAAELRRY